MAPKKASADLGFAMDRLAIWKAAVSGMREMNVEPTALDALNLADFLTGDYAPRSDDAEMSANDEEASDDA